MNDFRIRGMTEGDAPGVTRMLAAAEQVDRTEEHYNVDDIVEEFQNPMIDPSRDWLLVDHDGQVVGHSRLQPRAPADGSISVSIDGTVHPEFRRRGIGSALVPQMLARARECVEERGTDLRPVITASAPSENLDLRAIYERAGLRPDRWSFVMLADLAAIAPEDVALPDGYTLHTWEGIDHDEVRAAHNRSFDGHPGWTPWSAQMWSQWVSDSRNFRPALSLLARAADGTVAAYIHTAEFDAVAEAIGIREAYVSKVGTTPEHRRRGLATTLLRIALTNYRDAGFDRAALDVDSENPSGALGVYERAGFRTQMRWTDYRSDGA